MARRWRDKRTESLAGLAVGLGLLIGVSPPGIREQFEPYLWGGAALGLAGLVRGGLLLWQKRRAGKPTASSAPAAPVRPAPEPAAPATSIAHPRPASPEPAAPAPGLPVAQAARPSTWTLELLQALEWKRFEALCAGYCRALGYAPRTTRRGPDGGVDVALHRPGEERPEAIVQCKAWKTYKVGVKPVRELLGVMAAQGVGRGIFVTTGEYTAEARAFAAGQAIELVSGAALLGKLAELPADVPSRLLAEATAGDYTTPTCPSCGVKMALRTSSKDGSRFWGCRHYPRCRVTLRHSVPAGAAA